MHSFICETEAFDGKLNEHINYAAMKIKNLNGLIEADVQLVNNLMEKYSD